MIRTDDMPPLLHDRTHRSLRLALVTACIFFPHNLLGQSDRSHPVADSAAVARDRYREAVAQARAGNPKGALASAQGAATAWPAQPAYLGLVAALAAQLRDTSLAVRSLDQLSRLGARYPVGLDPAFAELRESEAVAAAVDQMERATAPLVGSVPAAVIGPADFFAEGVAVGPDGSIYLGSIRHRTVLRRRPDGSVAELLPSPDGLWAVSGIALDPHGRTLWVSSNAIPQMAGYDSALEGRSELVRLALDGTGVLSRHPVGRQVGGAMVGEILVAPDGTVYASDTRGQAIWRLTAGGDATPEVIARHPLLRSPQGLVQAVDGTTLLVADYSHGLVRVDPATGGVLPVTVPDGVTLLGIDGLARHGQDLIAVQNGGVVPRVIRIRLDATERAVLGIELLDRNLTVADEPTLGMVAGEDFFYVANSQWEKRGADGSPRAGVTLQATVILRLPLGPGGR